MVVKLRKLEMFILQFTYTVDMAKNLGQPLFQDYSAIGRFIGFSVRFTWMLIGGTLSLITIIPLGIFLLIFALLPIIAIIQIPLSLLGIAS